MYIRSYFVGKLLLCKIYSNIKHLGSIPLKYFRQTKFAQSSSLLVFLLLLA